MFPQLKQERIIMLFSSSDYLDLFIWNVVRSTPAGGCDNISDASVCVPVHSTRTWHSWTEPSVTASITRNDFSGEEELFMDSLYSSTALTWSQGNGFKSRVKPPAAGPETSSIVQLHLHVFLPLQVTTSWHGARLTEATSTTALTVHVPASLLSWNFAHYIVVSATYSTVNPALINTDCGWVRRSRTGQSGQELECWAL